MILGFIVCIINIILAWYLGNTPYLPIELSKIANEFPQFWLFLVAMFYTAIEIYSYPNITPSDLYEHHSIYIGITHIPFGLGVSICREIIHFPFGPVMAICLIMLALFTDRGHWWIHVMAASSFFYIAFLYLWLKNIVNIQLFSAIALTLILRPILFVYNYTYGHSIWIERIKASCQWINILLFFVCLRSKHNVK